MYSFKKNPSFFSKLSNKQEMKTVSVAVVSVSVSVIHGWSQNKPPQRRLGVTLHGETLSENIAGSEEKYL